MLTGFAEFIRLSSEISRFSTVFCRITGLFFPKFSCVNGGSKIVEHTKTATEGGSGSPILSDRVRRSRNHVSRSPSQRSRFKLPASSEVGYAPLPANVFEHVNREG